MKRNGALNSNQQVDHINPLKSGGSNDAGNLQVKDASSNMSAGGEMGSSAGKSAGARKGHKSRKKKNK